jgi:3-deoxy-D-manno-octulosonic acid kinase
MGVQLPEWMAAEYGVIRAGRTTAVVRNDFVDSFHRHRLADCARAPLLSVPGADPEGAPGSVMGGRGGIRIIHAGALGEAVVRPYRRGGLVEKVNRRRYFLGDRAISELVSTRRLHRRRAPVPEALAAVQSRVLPGYEACLVTRRIPKVRPAAAVLAGASSASRTGILESMGRAIRLLHEAGGVHADLNAYNILVQEGGEVRSFVIDLDRASVLDGQVPERHALANLQRLQRSFLKIGLLEALTDWADLERGYAAALEPPPAA